MNFGVLDSSFTSMIVFWIGKRVFTELVNSWSVVSHDLIIILSALLTALHGDVGVMVCSFWLKK